MADYPPRTGINAPAPAQRCEQVQAPRDDQGVINSLVRAYHLERLPEDIRNLLARIR